jgi:hypothetical protein
MLAKNEPGDFDRFSNFRRRLVAVPHSEIKARLDAEKMRRSGSLNPPLPAVLPRNPSKDQKFSRPLV